MTTKPLVVDDEEGIREVLEITLKRTNDRTPDMQPESVLDFIQELVTTVDPRIRKAGIELVGDRTGTFHCPATGVRHNFIRERFTWTRFLENLLNSPLPFQKKHLTFDIKRFILMIDEKR
jgi:hypothetical protein